MDSHVLNRRQAKAGPIRRARDRALLNAAKRTFDRSKLGTLNVVMPSGLCSEIGVGGQDVPSIRLNSLMPLWRSVRRGGLGFAESFIEGEIETDDLAGLIRYFLDNYETLVATGRGRFDVSRSDRRWHAARDNTREGSRSNIAAHYDLGNAFYAKWLDPGMTYSSALTAGGAGSLEAAQQAKYALTLDALDLKPGERLLEIGCGWGGMVEQAVRAGSDVTAITVSKEQLAYARDRIAAAGLQGGADLRFQDYRDLAGSFDKLVSIEMIEAVGEAHWPTYFATIARSLNSGGTAVLQAITIREEDFDIYRARPDFIQRYIFPGGMLPTVSLMREHARRAGLEFETVKRFGQCYAWTLAEWRKRFAAAWPEIQPLGFDERFRRMWEYYLIYCEVGFERAVVDVGTYRLRKA